MVSPLGRTLTNAFLCPYEKLQPDNSPLEVKPVAQRSYVDNIFISPRSNFSFSLLDVKITRGSKGFSTSVKATFTGVFTNFDSFILECCKTGLTFRLLFRCFSICSNVQSFHLEADQWRQIFKCNNHSVTLTDQCVKTLLNKIFVPKRI